jgi:hypothetical protein
MLDTPAKAKGRVLIDALLRGFNMAILNEVLDHGDRLPTSLLVQ